MKLRLRPTLLSDLDYVLSLERAADNRPFITPWDRTQHEAAVRFPDFRHFIIESGDDWAQSGFVILVGLRNQHHNVELKRIVVARKGQGVGRACVRRLKRMAFDDLGAHRFWLDVKSNNPRARAMYESEGFKLDGVLRECLLVDGQWLSLSVYSMLRHEFDARAQSGLEPLWNTLAQPQAR
jgi:RimJ/RimL family protein N-acetyltransferase